MDSHSVGSSGSLSLKSKSWNSRGRRNRQNRQANCLARQSSKRRAAAAGKRVSAPSMSLGGLFGPPGSGIEGAVMEDAECSEMMIKHWSDIPSFSDLADIDTTPGLTPLVTPAVDEVQLSVASSAGHTEQFSAKDMVRLPSADWLAGQQFIRIL